MFYSQKQVRGSDKPGVQPAGKRPESKQRWKKKKREESSLFVKCVNRVQCYPAIKLLDSTEHLSALRLLCHTNITMAQAQEHTLLNCPPSTAAPAGSAPIPHCSNLRRETLTTHEIS